MTTLDQAYEMGAKGAEPTERERLLFEAWMRGHCWMVHGDWDGKTYVHATERNGEVNYHTMHTRQLWAAWRDRAALAKQPAQPQQEPVAVAYFENITGRIVPPDDTHRRKFPMCYRPLVFGDTSPPAQRKPLTDDAKVLLSLLGAALGALQYHTEQTRPIQRTKETIAAIEHELTAHNIKKQP